MINTDVVIPLEEFERLVEDRKELFMLLDAIFTNCIINSECTYLMFNNIEQIMQIIEPKRYQDVLNKLKKERNEVA